jgi:asparagine synthase (glutamine-hydrolysing)
MCGIAGAVGNFVSAELADRTLRGIHHRGPDATGIFRGSLARSEVVLLHTRLAIVDLEVRSNQPLEAEGCALIFNGEIYNFPELRRELESLGHCFRTRSDTEVIIHAYREWGPGCVRKMEGMWAFALLDIRKDTLMLSRDRFGQKPLYYATCKNTLFFASEIKSLTMLSEICPKPDLDQVKRYLVNGYRSLYKQPNTFFEGVAELPPGTYVEIKGAQMGTPISYWQLSYQPTQMTLDDAISRTKELVTEAVRVCLRADAPVSFCLSGGIDSTLLACLAALQCGERIHTFSIIDRDERYNETDNISRTVQHLNCDHTQIEVTTEGFWEVMQNLIAHRDSPVATISYYVHSLLSKAIHEHGYKVAISGTAADELFTGYFDHYGYWLAEQSTRADIDVLLRDWEDGYGAVVRNPILKDPMVFSNNPNERGHIYLERESFNQLLVDPITEQFAEASYSSNLLRNRMLNELHNEVVPVLLKEDDLNSMHWSVENRSPYLDSALAEFAYTIPNKHLIHNGYAKWVLRAVGLGLAPDEVMLDKRKRGFNASIDSLVDRRDPETLERLLSPSPIFDLVNYEAMEKFLTRNFQSNSFSKFLFSFISAKLFLENDLVNGDLDSGTFL